MSEKRFYVIYSLSPAPMGRYHCRFVEMFESIEDATHVLEALNKVNILFHCYKIFIETKEQMKAEKETILDD